MSPRNIAYIGLGIMGAPMASHLAEGGHQVFAYNRTPGKPGVDTAREAGAKIVTNTIEAVKQADVVFCCLSDVADIENMLADEKLLAACKPGTLFVDMSTTGQECAKRLHKHLTKHGLRFLDAPVTGGDIGARNGTLTIMVGGEKNDYEECLPLLQLMGKNITYCGPAGSGQAVKLCNQILCAVNLIGVSEALSLATELGIDPNLVVDVCSTGAAGSWSLANLGPKILKEDFAPAFKIKDMRKDLRLIAETVGEIKSKFPGTALADAHFAEVEKLPATTGSDQGTQAMFKAYKNAKASCVAIS